MKTFAQVRDAIIETYDAANEHRDKANAAQQEGKTGEYHRHMTNFHDAMSEWHDERGRSGSSDMHSRLADDHDNKARELGEVFVVFEAKADPTGSWIVHNSGKVTKFKTHSGAKAYAKKNGGQVASSEYYHDKIKKQSVVEDVTDHKYEPHNNATMKTSKGHTHAGVSYNSTGNKGANILKHGDTGKYFAAGGSSSSTNARTTYHDSPEAAAKEYHSRYKKTVSEAMSARLKLADALRKRQEAREAAQKRNQEWLKGGSEKKEEKPEVKEEKMKGKDPCWAGYKMLGTKNKNGKQVPNCIPESIEESIARLVSNSIKKVTTRKITPQEKADIRLNK
jgi:hypothetical protein